MDLPLVSVVIPTYNSADFLPATLESVLEQSYPKIEIIVVDDGSKDDTSAILSPFKTRVKYIRQENWGGPSRPRNVGISASEGELISFFDSDDLMLPGKIAESVAAFANHPTLGLVFTNFQGIDEDGQVRKKDFLATYQDFRVDLQGDSESSVQVLPARKAYSQLLKANFIGTSSVMCRKAVLDKVGSFDEKMLNADDVDMWRRVSFAGFDFAFVNGIYHGYRRRAGGVTARGTGRFPAVLYGLGKQVDLELEPWESQLVKERIQSLELAYGSGLYREGAFPESLQVFSSSLRSKISTRGIIGWIKAFLKNQMG